MRTTKGNDFTCKNASAILTGTKIEECIRFWEEKLGFNCVTRVPEGEQTGFAILNRDQVTVMYQTKTSIADDLRVELDPTTIAIVYLNVDTIEPFKEIFSSAEIVVPLRKTFYGATEIFVRDPAGNIIGISEHQEN